MNLSRMEAIATDLSTVGGRRRFHDPKLAAMAEAAAAVDAKMMPNMGWASIVNTNSGPGSATTNGVTTAVDISALPAFTIGQNMPLPTGGEVFYVLAGGIITSTTATPTLIITLQSNSVAGAAGTAILSSPTNAISASASSWPWRMEARMQILTLGSSGTVQTRGVFWWPTSLTAWTATPIPQSNIASATINTTVATPLTISSTFSATTATSTVTLQYFDVLVGN